eukprot:Em0001g2529a
MNEADPSKTRALESCLWEFQTLMSHYVPKVSDLVKRLVSPSEKKVEEDLGQYLDVDDDDLVQEECTELEGLKRVPMAYEEPAGLWWNPAETGSDQTKWKLFFTRTFGLGRTSSMAQYKGAASEGARAMNLMKKREQQRQELEKMKQKIAEEHAIKSNFEVTNKFATSFDMVEEQLKSSTVGLVTLEQMKEKRENLVKEREMQIAAALAAAKREEEKKQAKKEARGGGVLSFDFEGEEGEEEEEGGGKKEKKQSDKETSPPASKKKKMIKNPTVDTSFLPDKDREEAEQKEREHLRQEWLEKQEKIKNEDIDITYSYWDGSGHRKHVQMKKGDSIRQFLQKCLESLRKDFSELRAAGPDSLIYVKEDLIIPQHHTFYDFIVTKARGKSGPLFSFDVHEDVRIINDASLEKDESHAGKVCLRSWYERNKHIFPASRWEPYDPAKNWEKYTIADKDKD